MFAVSLIGTRKGHIFPSEKGSTGHVAVKLTLFIRGELSNYILDEDEAGIRKMYPCAEIVTVEGAGHWVHIDARESFIDIVLKYVA